MHVLLSRHAMARGFTLVETMVVVAILGIMTALAVGGLGPAVRNLRVAEAAEQVEDAVAFARATARATSRCTKLDLIVPGAPGADAAQPQLAANRSGTTLRIWRWKALDCAGATGPAKADLIGEVPLPTEVGARLDLGELEFLGNGRPQPQPAANAPAATFIVDALQTLGAAPAAASAQAVRVSAAGRTCRFRGAAPGECR